MPVYPGALGVYLRPSILTSRSLLTMPGPDDQQRFSFPFVESCPHSLNISFNALGRFDAVVAREQVLFNVLHFPPRERAEQIRFQHLIIGVPPRYRTHSSTPCWTALFGASNGKSIEGGVVFAITILEAVGVHVCNGRVRCGFVFCSLSYGIVCRKMWA